MGFGGGNDDSKWAASTGECGPGPSGIGGGFKDASAGPCHYDAIGRRESDANVEALDCDFEAEGNYASGTIGGNTRDRGGAYRE